MINENSINVLIIGKGIQNYWKLNAIDSIDSSSASPQLPTEEYNRLIALNRE